MALFLYTRIFYFLLTGQVGLRVICDYLISAVVYTRDRVYGFDTELHCSILIIWRLNLKLRNEFSIAFYVLL